MRSRVSTCVTSKSIWSAYRSHSVAVTTCIVCGAFVMMLLPRGCLPVAISSASSRILIMASQNLKVTSRSAGDGRAGKPDAHVDVAETLGLCRLNLQSSRSARRPSLLDISERTSIAVVRGHEQVGGWIPKS